MNEAMAQDLDGLPQAARAGGLAGGRPGASRWGRVVRLAAVGGSAAAVVAYVAVSGLVVLAVTRPERVPFTHFPEQYGLSYEPVRFPSRVDAIQLDGWLLAPAAAGGTTRPPAVPVVMVHGKGADRQRELGGRFLEVAAHLVRQGHPVLLFDLRGFGRSGGTRYTLGAQEVRDVGGVVDFLDRRGLTANGVVLLGYSMGTAPSLLVAAGEPRVRAVIVDSPYAELGDILDVQVPKASGLPPFFTPGIVLMAWPLMGVNAYAIRPIDGIPALAARGAPLLVIHGDADDWVPIAHGRRLAAAYDQAGRGRAETYFVPGATHVGSYQADPAAYLARVTAFLDAAVSTAPAANR